MERSLLRNGHTVLLARTEVVVITGPEAAAIFDWEPEAPARRAALVRALLSWLLCAKKVPRNAAWLDKRVGRKTRSYLGSSEIARLLGVRHCKALQVRAIETKCSGRARRSRVRCV